MTTVNPAEIAKAITAAIGVATVVVASALLHGTAETTAETILGILTAAATYLVPNAAPAAAAVDLPAGP